MLTARDINNKHWDDAAHLEILAFRICDCELIIKICGVFEEQ